MTRIPSDTRDIRQERSNASSARTDLVRVEIFGLARWVAPVLRASMALGGIHPPPPPSPPPQPPRRGALVVQARTRTSSVIILLLHVRGSSGSGITDSATKRESLAHDPESLLIIRDKSIPGRVKQKGRRRQGSVAAGASTGRMAPRQTNARSGTEAGVSPLYCDGTSAEARVSGAPGSPLISLHQWRTIRRK